MDMTAAAGLFTLTRFLTAPHPALNWDGYRQAEL
jgi:hypothetical protein